MGRRNDGGAAFPIRGVQHDEDIDTRDPGMSLRDHFAAKAMEGFLAHGVDLTHVEAIPEWAYRLADGMIAAREKNYGKP